MEGHRAAGPVAFPRAARGTRQRRGREHGSSRRGSPSRAEQHGPVQPRSQKRSPAQPHLSPPPTDTPSHAPGPSSSVPSSSVPRRHAGLQPGPGRRAAGSAADRSGGAERRARGGAKRLRSPSAPGPRRHNGRPAALTGALGRDRSSAEARRGAVRPCPPPGGTGRRQPEPRGRAGRGGGAGP